MTLFEIAGKLTVDSGDFVKKLEAANKAGESTAKIFGEVSLSVKDAGEQAEKSRSGWQRLGDSVQKFGMRIFALKQIGSVVGGVLKTIGNFGLSLAQTGFQYNMQMEQYTTNFKVLLGSTEAAVAKVEELKKMAAKTPFTMGDLADATQQLLAFQVPANETNEILRMLGDISLGDSQKLSGLALVFGQVASAGKLSGQDLMQFINQGFNPLNYIAQRTGESMAELRDRMSQGKVTVQEVKQAMIDATSAGGMFYNGSEEGAKTVAGQWSTLKDNWEAFLGKIMEPVNLEMGNSIIPALIRGLDKISTALFGVEEDAANAKKQIFTDENGAEIDPSANLKTWFTDLMQVWTDGKPEDDAIVSNFVDGFRANTKSIADALQARIDDVTGAYTEEEKKDAEDKIAELQDLTSEVEQLLKKRQNKTITPDEENRIQTILARISEIQAGLGATATVDEKVLSPWEKFVQKIGGMATDGIDSLATLIADFLSDPEKLENVITSFTDGLTKIPTIAQDIATIVNAIAAPIREIKNIWDLITGKTDMPTLSGTLDDIGEAYTTMNEGEAPQTWADVWKFLEDNYVPGEDTLASFGTNALNRWYASAEVGDTSGDYLIPLPEGYTHPNERPYRKILPLGKTDQVANEETNNRNYNALNLAEKILYSLPGYAESGGWWHPGMTINNTPWGMSKPEVDEPGMIDIIETAIENAGKKPNTAPGATVEESETVMAIQKLGNDINGRPVVVQVYLNGDKLAKSTAQSNRTAQARLDAKIASGVGETYSLT